MNFEEMPNSADKTSQESVPRAVENNSTLNDASILKSNEQLQEENASVDKTKTALSLINTMEQGLLTSEGVRQAGGKLAEERIKADLFEEASNIRKQNVSTSEKNFEIETKEKRLKQLKAELDLDHVYRMSILKQDNKHTKMLDKRKKLEEKYGYLYDKNEDGSLNDFSYSPTVNKIRTFTRNVSRLDTTVKKSLKWGVILGIIGGTIFLLRHFGVLG